MTVFGDRRTAGALTASLVAAVLALTAAPVRAADPDDAPAGDPGSISVPLAQVAASPELPASEVADGWSVLDGPSGAVATWTSATPLPVVSARPEVTLRDRPLPVAPTVAPDGRSLSVAVPTGTVADDLDVVLSGVVLDAPGTAQQRRSLPGGTGAAVAADPDQGPDLGVDPGVRGPYTVTRSDYTRDDLPFPGFDVPLEVVGHVVAPTAGQVTGKPLVLFLHGRHLFCYDPADPENLTFDWPCAAGSQPIRSDLGYDYLQELLATQGYTTVSIAANGINAQDGEADDGGARARSALVQRHLDLWAQRSVPGSEGVDLDRVVLVGHSRGGEGVDLAAQQVPLSAPYRVAGQVLLGPTDFARRTAAYVPTVTVLPYCDGDVSDLQGQMFTDTSRGLAAGDTALKSSVLVMGANHNFFNTEWTPGDSVAPSEDDWFDEEDTTCGSAATGRLSASEQRDVGAAYVAGAVQTFTAEGPGTPDTLAMFDGTPGHVASAGDAVVYSHAVGAGRDLVLPASTTATGAQGATVRICRGTAEEGDRTGCGAGVSSSRAPHWAPVVPSPGLPTQSALEMTWAASGAVGTMALAEPWDLSDGGTLDLRALAAPSRGTVEVSVRLRDSAGGQVDVVPAGDGTVRALPGKSGSGLGKLVAQQLRVRLDDVSGVDLSQVTSVSLVARSARGKVWVLDVSRTPDALPAVPSTRLPMLGLGALSLTEASGTGARTAEVPWTITGDTSRASSFRLLRYGFDGTLRVSTVQVPAGTTSGTIPVPYTADRVFNGDRVAQVLAFPLTGVGVADGNGQAVLADDDPPPAVGVSVPDSVREGRPVTVTVTLSRPAGIDVAASPSFLRPTLGPRANARDLSRRWVDRFTDAERRNAPLWERGVDLAGVIDAGKRRVTMRIPTRVDRAREGRERLRIRVEVPGLDYRTTRTVLLRDR